MAAAKRDVIVLTGFGAFGEHKVNASWEVVKMVQSLNVERDLNCKLVVEEIPVVYDVVAARIPALWAEHKPTLVVHVGVSSQASGLTVECRAFNDGYVRPDVNDQKPCEECCSGRSAVNVIDCALNVASACKAVNDAMLGVTSQKSTFAGRYLCEFMYYKSLSIDNTRTIFIHVPQLDKGMSALDMAKGIVKILENIMKQIRSRK